MLKQLTQLLIQIFNHFFCIVQSYKYTQNDGIDENMKGKAQLLGFL